MPTTSDVVRSRNQDHAPFLMGEKRDSRARDEADAGGHGDFWGRERDRVASGESAVPRSELAGGVAGEARVRWAPCSTGGGAAGGRR